MNYSFNDSYDLYEALCDALPKERQNIIKGANLNIKDDDGWTALMYAACNDREDIVDSLIKAGANKDIQDNDGWTALMVVAYEGRKDIVDSLIKAGANLNIKNNDGCTALMVVAKKGRKDIVDSLIKAGADLNIKDNDGWTALMHAAKHGYKDIVESLIEAHIQDGSIYTALMYAANVELVKAINQRYIKKLAELEQKNAKLEAQQAWNKFQDKKREQKRMTNLLLRKYRTRTK